MAVGTERGIPVALERSVVLDPHGLKKLIGATVLVRARVRARRHGNPHTNSARAARQFMWLLGPVDLAGVPLDHLWIQGCKRNAGWVLGERVEFTGKLGWYTDSSVAGVKFRVHDPIRPLPPLPPLLPSRTPSISRGGMEDKEKRESAIAIEGEREEEHGVGSEVGREGEGASEANEEAC